MNTGLFYSGIAPSIEGQFNPQARVVLVHGDALEFLRSLPDGVAKLIITSPPYNIGKEYEVQTRLECYLDSLTPAIQEMARVLSPNGSLCWQVGNYVQDSEVFPLDIWFYPIFKGLGFHLRNRIIWHFQHGLHCSVRFSGRYETLLWFTKSDDYTFNLDAVRVPAKYPGKTHYTGPKRGLPSGNPLGKNPSDVWALLAHEWETGLWDIPNVKSNHPEKTLHPCQFPIELVERCVLAFTEAGDWVLDPFSGVGSALLAALRHGRRAMGCDKEASYIAEAKSRIHKLFDGTLPYRPLGKPVYQPTGREKVCQIPFEWAQRRETEAGR